jgi:hypothetical protein
MTGRVIYVAVGLLDRQLIDRDGAFCGKVDDLELTLGPDGALYVSHVVSGPGALWYRLRRRLLGRWLRTHLSTVPDVGDDPGRIPVRLVSDIASSVRLSLSRRQLSSNAGEIWVRDHIIGHIPGSRHHAHE